MAKLSLGAVLKKKKLSKRKFAQLLGISYHNVFRLFHENQDPRLSALSKYAKALKCRVRDLIKE